MAVSTDDPDIILVDLEDEDTTPETDAGRSQMQCIFTWRIANFSHCHIECDEGLSSPIFTDDSGHRWFMTVFPSGEKDYEQHVSMHVISFSKIERDQEKIFCEVSILDSSSAKWRSEGNVKDRADIGRFEFKAFVTRDELLFEKERILPDDVLTVCCQLCDFRETSPGESTKDSQDTARVLRADERLRKFSDDFKALYRSGKFSDVSLVLKDGTIPAHKVILIARSLEFARHLRLPDVTELRIPEFGKQTMDALLSYIYTGEIDPSCSVLPLDLYQAAKKYQVSELERMITPSRIFAQTEVINEKYSYSWRLKNFTTTNKNSGRLVYSSKFHTGPNELWSLSLYFPHHDSSSECDDIGIYLNKLWRANEKKPVFVKFQTYVLDKDKEPRFKIGMEKCFKQTNRFGTTSFVKRSDLLSDRDSLLPGDALTICCEMSVSDSGFLSKIEHSYSSSTPELYEISDIHNVSDCFRRLLHSNENTDVTVKCAGKQKFCLHKAILCARSPKFANFFESQDIDLLPGAQNRLVRGYRFQRQARACQHINIIIIDLLQFTIDITGTSYSILELLFLLIYTGKVEGLSSETAEELFAAATYYEISEAKGVFSNYLQSNLTTSNAFQMMTLSMTMGDTELKNSVLDFICSNAEVLITSRHWFSFMREHQKEATEVMKYMADGYRKSKRRRHEK